MGSLLFRPASVLAIMLLALASAHAESAVERPPVDLRQALGPNVGIEPVDVAVDDQTYKRAMRYRGYPLAAVLRAHYPDVDAAAAAGAELVLRAADGYAPSMDLAKALKGTGVIAFRDLNRSGEAWEPFRQGKETITPAPYYLVWPGVDPSDPSYKWPYQLVSIELQPFETRYGAAVPKGAAGGDDRARRGFLLFKENCMGCHSVNLVGGDLAPELNVPKNVTEYWRKEDIRALVRNAASFRARSKMPAFPLLAEADLDALLHYLEAMRAQKVCDASKACPD